MSETYLIYRISDGLCVNAIKYDGIAPYTSDEGYALIQQSNNAWVGWTYDSQTNTFTAPIEGENGENSGLNN